MDHSITCPFCGVTSHNPNDIENGWCGACNEYTSLSDGYIRACLRADGDDPSPEKVGRLLNAWMMDADNLTIIEWMVDRRV